MMTFSLTAQLPSGKNQVGITTRDGRIRRFPNQRFTDWRRQAAKEVMTQVKAKEKPLRGRCHLQVHYTPADQRRRDLSGMLDALFHLCEYCGLLEDDNQIQTMTWWRLPGPSGITVTLYPDAVDSEHIT